MTFLIDKEFIDAVDFVYQERISKDYKLKRPNNANDDDFIYNNVAVPRPNHGLPHVVRTAIYVPLVIIESGDNYNIAEIKQVMIARLFFITGRENEASHEEDEAQYNQFREASAKLYERYIQEKKTTQTPEMTKFFRSIIARHYNEYTGSRRCAILRICHNIDLLRCYTRAKYQTTIQDLSPRLKSLIDRVELTLKSTGDRICGETDYNKELFYRCSTDVNFCITQVKKSLFPETYNQLNTRATWLYQFERYQEAALCYRKAQLESSEKDFDLLVKLGRTYIKLNSLELAYEYFFTAVQLIFEIETDNIGLFLNHFALLQEKLHKVPFTLGINDEQLQKKIISLKGLTKLALREGSVISDPSLKLIGTHLKELTILDLSKAKGFTQAAIDQLIKDLPALQIINTQ